MQATFATEQTQARKLRSPMDDLARKRRASAPGLMHPAMAESEKDSMLYWLAEAAKEFRQSGERHHVHIAATMDTNQSTIARFEGHKAHPRNLDATIGAYGEDLGIDPFAIWMRALELWNEDRASGQSRPGLSEAEQTAADLRDERHQDDPPSDAALGQ